MIESLSEDQLQQLASQYSADVDVATLTGEQRILLRDQLRLLTEIGATQASEVSEALARGVA